MFFRDEKASCKEVDQLHFDFKSMLGKVVAVEGIVSASCARLKANLISNSQFNGGAVVAGIILPNACLVETRFRCAPID